MASRSAAPLVLMLLAACGDDTDYRPATWSYIAPAIMTPSCATVSCHSRAAAVAGLDFSDADRGYKSLTALWVWIVDPSGTPEAGCRTVDGRVVCQRDRRPLVTPYNPSQSRLVQMLRARGADRMPPDRPLPEADIALIERWILNGARRESPARSPADASVTPRDLDAGQGANADADPDPDPAPDKDGP